MATNINGDSIAFDHRLRLINGLDLSGLGADVNASESISDGAIYQNTRLRSREFALELHLRRLQHDDAQMDDKRALMYRVFNPKTNPIRIDFENSIGKKYYLNANLLSTPIMGPDKSNNNAARQKVLLEFLAPDPFVYASESSTEDLASWVSAFEFPLEIVDGGIEMGYRSPSLIKNIVNGGSEEIGMIIEFKALAGLSRPSLLNVNTYEQFKLNCNMINGDVIRVNTNRRQKSIVLIRNNVEINIFNQIELSSKFLQLKPGDNLFRYNADSGLDNLEIRITYRDRYVGV